MTQNTATHAAKDLLASLDPATLNPEQFNAWHALDAALRTADPVDAAAPSEEPVALHPKVPGQAAVGDPLDWAVYRWHAEVANRPLRNVHRRSLDDTWRQVIRHFGGDPVELCGPSHDDLVAAAPTHNSGEE